MNLVWPHSRVMFFLMPLISEWCAPYGGPRLNDSQWPRLLVFLCWRNPLPLSVTCFKE